MLSNFEHELQRGASRKLQLVQAGQNQFGIFADQISAIVEWQEPAPLPHAPSSVLGVVSVQGRMLTVLDLAKLAGAEVVLTDTPNKFLGHLIALRGDEQLALAVEALGEVVQLTGKESLTNSITETVTGPVLGVWQREEAEIKVLNSKGLFPAAIQGRERRQRRF
ncbi:MAG TPA: chemotaxis protein CheW [Pyrinomonadaceae bacterium]|nr:chemotaxis protein CheW [Pyrinomonadaceae bacterium]